MFRIGTKVKVPKLGKRGIITYVGMDASWYNIKTNKGLELKLIPFNMVESRESGWHNG